jgi:hypothetical protein
MLAPVEWLIVSLGTLFEAAFVVCSLRRGLFRRYIFLNLFTITDVLASFARLRILHQFGRSSNEYKFFYFYSDALLILLLYFAIISLYSRVFQEMSTGRYVRLAAVLILGGTACVSAAVLSESSGRMLTNFAYELSQNLYFVGVVLTYVLWGAILKLRETRALLVQFVLSLGIYFSAYTASYAISNLQPDLYSHVRYLVPVIGCLLPLCWSYAILRVPEDARIAPAQLATVPR